MMEDFKVTLRDVKDCKLCMSGARVWCATRDVAWSELLNEGLWASRLEAMDDAFGNRALAQARRRLGLDRR
jgi:hypothetical protein